MERSHCSKEDLLRHLDGECSHAEARTISEHLKTCWACREEASDLETSLTRLSDVILDGLPLPPGRMTAARVRLNEMVAMTTVAMPTATRRWRTLLAGAAAAVAVVAAAVMFLTPRPAAHQRESLPTSALDLLHGIRAREAAVIQGDRVLEQAFDIEYDQIAPPRRKLKGELRVVADSSGENFLSQWQPKNRATTLSIWKSGVRQEFRLSNGEAIPPTVARLRAGFSITDLALAEASEIEENLLAWLLAQNWRPVSLSGDFWRFVSGTRAAMTIDRRTLPSGEQVVVFSAMRQIGDAVVRASFSARTSDYQPRLRSIRVERGQRVWELRVLLQQQRVLARASLSKDFFIPATPSRRPARTAGRNLPLTDSAASDGLPGLVEAYLAAHGTNALVQEQLKIKLEDGIVRVSGNVGGPDRRRELMLAFGTAIRSAPLSMEIIDITAGLPRLPSQVVTVLPESSAAPADVQVYDFLEDVAAGTRHKQVREYGNRAVLLANRALAQVWALREIAQQFDPVAMDRLSPMDRSRVETMIFDHLAALQFHISELRAHVTPLLAKSGTNDLRPDPPPPLESWHEAISRTFATVMRVHRAVYALFTVDVRGTSTVPAAMWELQAVLSHLGAGIDGIRPLINRKDNSQLVSKP